MSPTIIPPMDVVYDHIVSTHDRTTAEDCRPPTVAECREKMIAELRQLERQHQVVSCRTKAYIEALERETILLGIKAVIEGDGT